MNHMRVKSMTSLSLIMSLWNVYLTKSLFTCGFNLPFFTCISGNPTPTRKLAIQLTSTAILIAAGRGPWLNNSATINQGMDPKYNK